jgi:hypothetical protein
MITPTGAETVKLEVDGALKTGLTAMGTITAADTKNFPYSWWRKD